MLDKLSDFYTIVCTMKTTTLTTRDFFRSPKKIADILARGQRITVTRQGQDFFEVVPVAHPKPKTIADFKHLIFSDPTLDKNLSSTVDEIVYGQS